jgi:hypothetical protein
MRDARDKGYFRVQRQRRFICLPDGTRLHVFDRVPSQLQPGWGDYLRTIRAACGPLRHCFPRCPTKGRSAL